jgi:hypothetical protein
MTRASASWIFASVALLVVQINALDLGASINLFSASKQFIVRIVQQLPFLDDVSSERFTAFRDGEGQDYSCILPALPTDRDVSADAKALYKEQSAKELLQSISGDCVRQMEGWWIFEVCVGKHVRQYHMVSSPKKDIR